MSSAHTSPSFSPKHRILVIFIVVFSTLFGLALSACNTVEGAGEDIEDAGEGIQDAAD
jgi:entericidin B